MGTVVVGFEGSGRARDALVLGEALAVSLDATLVVACVHSVKARTGAIGAAGFDRETREGARRTAESARPLLARPAEADFTATLGLSAAAGLADLARTSGAAAIVVGSSHRGPVGRVLLGSVGRQLMSRTPCPVAVAPAGYAQAGAPWDRVGVAFDGSPASQAAVHLAESIAARLHARLRLLSVGDEALGGELNEAVAAAPVSARADGILRSGDPADQLALASADVDILVCGSRGHGRLRQLALGSVSGALIERTCCPLVITAAR